jgi:hypothetical protein
MDARSCQVLAAIVFAGVLVAARSALADEPTAGPGMSTTSMQLKLAPFGEPTGDRALEPTIAVLPLRLSLINEAFPIGRAYGDDPCASSGDSAGNSIQGFPILRQAYLPITPRLVLHGFSRGGCPIDAGIGGGLTYSIPLPANLWLVASAGVYTQPSVAPGPALFKPDARLDVLLRKTPDSALSLGIGRRGIALTGLW